MRWKPGCVRGQEKVNVIGLEMAGAGSLKQRRVGVAGQSVLCSAPRWEPRSQGSQVQS